MHIFRQSCPGSTRDENSAGTRNRFPSARSSRAYSPRQPTSCSSRPTVAINASWRRSILLHRMAARETGQPGSPRRRIHAVDPPDAGCRQAVGHYLALAKLLFHFTAATRSAAEAGSRNLFIPPVHRIAEIRKPSIAAHPIFHVFHPIVTKPGPPILSGGCAEIRFHIEISLPAQ